MSKLSPAKIEERAKAFCMERFGGYPVDRKKREAWPQWQQALRHAKICIVLGITEF